MEKISNYFQQFPINSNTNQQENKKTTLPSTESNTINDSMSDFETPKAINKITKMIQLKPPKPNQLKKSKTRKKLNLKHYESSKEMALQKTLQDNFLYSDVNADHLQMAIALSNSTYESENLSESCSSSSSSSQLDRRINLRDNLQKFGFNTRKTLQTFTKTNNKRSRYKYITPILYIRSGEEREKLINSKVSLILSNSNISKTVEESFTESSLNLFSTNLKKYVKQTNLIELNHLNLNELNNNNEKFYINSLHILSSKTNCGILLKNWREIPGRHPSPEPNISIIDNNLITVDDNNYNRSLTPDLFESEEEMNLSPKITPEKNPNVILSQSLLNFSPAKNRALILCSNNKSSSTNSSQVLGTEEPGVYPLEESPMEVNEAVDLTQSSPNDDDDDKSTGELDNNLINSCNVTDYVYNILTLDNQTQENLENDVVLDLTNDSSDEIDNILSSSITPDLVHVQNGFDNNLSPTTTTTTNKDLSQEENISQESTFLNDEEINYSCLDKKDKLYELSSDSDLEEISPNYQINLNKVDIRNKSKNFPPTLTVLNETPSTSKANFNTLESNQSTPKNHNKDLLIKTTDITPMPNYDEMNAPQIIKELEKYGLKPLKRQRGVKLLKYIYETTHPLVAEEDSDDEINVIKKRKISKEFCDNKSCRNLSKEINKSNNEGIEIVGDLISESEMMNGLIFERKQSTKIPSCRIPLEIVWHNFVSSNPTIRENILLYEPLQLEVLHFMLKEEGFKFNIQDLLTFLDRKCITIRINRANNDSKKRRKS